MPQQRDVAVLVGSLRRDSWNRIAAKAVADLAPKHLQFRFVDIAVSLYNQDLDTDTPPGDWRRLRDEISPADAVLFATPEYNRSVPGVLKNAFDIVSRPYGNGALLGKPGAIMSCSTGQMGGFGATFHLRQATTFVDMPMMQQPELYLSNAGQLFAPDGSVKEESTRQLLTKFGTAFADWIEQVRVRGAARTP